MTLGALTTLLGMIALAAVAVFGLVRGALMRHATGHTGISLAGCAMIFAAQCAFVVWPLAHYLDLRDGHTDLALAGREFRVASQLVWIWLLSVGLWLIIQKAGTVCPSPARRGRREP